MTILVDRKVINQSSVHVDLNNLAVNLHGLPSLTCSFVICTRVWLLFATTTCSSVHLLCTYWFIHWIFLVLTRCSICTILCFGLYFVIFFIIIIIINLSLVRERTGFTIDIFLSFTSASKRASSVDKTVRIKSSMYCTHVHIPPTFSPTSQHKFASNEL